MIELKAGQVWRTRDGFEVVLHCYEDSEWLYVKLDHKRSLAYDPQSPTGHLVFDGDPESEYDLMELVNDQTPEKD